MKIYILKDKKTGLYFNRNELKDVPAVYTLGVARRFKKHYNGSGWGMPSIKGFVDKVDLRIYECELVEGKELV